MAIAWDALKSRIATYLDQGKDDKTRTFEKAAFDIEQFYIEAVRNQGQDAFGNVVLSLNQFTLAASIREGFKSAVETPIPNPSLDVSPVPDIDVPTIDLSQLKIPDLTIPDISIPRLDLPELPNTTVPNLNLPQAPTSQESPLVSQAAPASQELSLEPQLPTSQALPTVPELPFISGVSEVPSFKLPTLPDMPELPEVKIPEIKFTPISLNLSDFIPKILNVIGLSGLMLTWSGALLSITIPPPGSVSVVSNIVVNPGSFPTMNVGTGNNLADEFVSSFQQHARTISGMTTALVYSGTTLVPVQFPWTGII